MPLTPPEEKTVLQRYLPIVDWLPKYDWGGSFRFDVIAALTVWALLVPEAMAYAGIAGVSPEVGLVTAPLALLGYAVLISLVLGAAFFAFGQQTGTGTWEPPQLITLPKWSPM